MQGTFRSRTVFVELKLTLESVVEAGHILLLTEASCSQDEPRPDVQGTFRSRTVFVGPSFMIAMGLDEEKERAADPLDDKVPRS